LSQKCCLIRPFFTHCEKPLANAHDTLNPSHPGPLIGIWGLITKHKCTIISKPRSFLPQPPPRPFFPYSEPHAWFRNLNGNHLSGSPKPPIFPLVFPLISPPYVNRQQTNFCQQNHAKCDTDRGEMMGWGANFEWISVLEQCILASNWAMRSLPLFGTLRVIQSLLIRIEKLTFAHISHILRFFMRLIYSRRMGKS